MKKIYLLLLVLVSFLNLKAIAQISSFIYTGAVQYYTVPTGVTSVGVDAKGAAGGQDGGLSSLGVTTPGKGGRVQATLAVTPGTVLNIYVGGQGGLGTSTGTTGGWNGGGASGGHMAYYGGGGGGGASDVRVAGVALANRVVVAAGGGGAGYDGSTCGGDQPGGDGGGLTGAGVTTCDATLISWGYPTITHTGGGTQVAGGIGGNIGGSYTAGFPGALGLGGSTALTPADPGIAGGGGGGYYGGGGGCWMGGGGGSSYTDPASCTAVTLTPGYQSGDGEVDICILDPGIISGMKPLCSGQTLTLTETIGSGKWTSSNNSIATIGSSTGIVTGVAGGMVYITYTIASACATVYTVTNMIIIQSPLPVIFTNPLCVGSSATLSDPTPGGLWTSSNTSLATIGSVSGIATGLYPGNPTITYMNPAAGCFTTFSLKVDGIAGPLKVCAGSSVTLVSSDGGGVWTSSNTSVAIVGTAGDVTGTGMGTCTISYSSPVCPSSVVMTVNPVAPIVAPDSICASGTSFFTNVVGGGMWLSSDAKTATIASGTGLVTGIKAGTVVMSYLLPTGCLSVHSTTVIALPPPILGYMQVCPDKSTTLSDPLSGGTWSSSNTSVATVSVNTGIVTGKNADTTYIYYTIKPGCSASAMFIVNPLPFPITGRDTICPYGFMDTLHDASHGGLWTTSTPLLDTIVDTTGVLTTRHFGTAVIKYTLATTCEITKNIYIYPVQKPKITFSPATNTFYTDLGYPGYQWYDSVSGKITHATSPSLADIYFEWYYVIVTDTNGCRSQSDTFYHEVRNVGVNNVANTGIKIYPNPTTGMLYISSPVKVRAVLSGIDGKIELQSEDARELDISRLSDAMYFISLYDESGQLLTVRKIVKE